MSWNVQVVIPVKNMSSHLHECLLRILPQLQTEDELTVVDDGSTDDLSWVSAEYGVSLVRTQSQGPYGARTIGASNGVAPLILFIDSRCRALPGLLDAHRDMLSRDGVALSCTNVRTIAGESYASRVSAERNPFSLDLYRNVSGRLDFFPTANLGVRRTAYDAVNGFSATRSGADADFCWRIQLTGQGRIAADPTILMEWVPRGTIRGMLEQYSRYGKSFARLEYEYPNDLLSGPTSSGTVVDRLSRMWRSEYRLGNLLADVVYQLSYKRASAAIRHRGSLK